MQAIWTLAIYDQSGTTVAAAHQHPNGAPIFSGDMTALAEALPAITGLARFFTDPDEQARAAYTAYATAWEATFGHAIWTWDEILAMPDATKKQKIISVWKTVAKASAAVDPALN